MRTPFTTSPRRRGADGPEAPILVEEPVYVRDSRAGDIDLREVIDLAVRGKWIVLGTLIALLAPTVLYTLWQPSLYKATATIRVESNEDAAAVLPGVMPNNPLIESERNLRNELLILDEDIYLAEAAAAEVLQYGRDPETQAPLTILQRANADGEVTRREVALLLQDAYITSELHGKDVDAIDVTAVSTSPGEAKLLANVYAETFADVAQASSRAGVTASADFLEDQVADASARLTDADAAAKTYMEREGAVALDEETTDIVSQLGTLEGQLDAVRNEAEAKAATIAAVEAQLAAVEGQQPRAAASTSGAELESIRAELVGVNARLEQVYLRNPDLRSSADVPEDVAFLRRQKESLEGRISRAAEQAVASGAGQDLAAAAGQADALRTRLTDDRIRLQALRAQSRRLSGRIGELERELANIPRQSIELAQRERERAAAEATYTSLESKLTEARIAQTAELGYARVIRPAFTPEAPFAPSRGRNVALAVFFGLAFGVMLAVARVRLDHRLFRPDDVQNLGFPLIGTIPDTDELIKKEFGGSASVAVDGREVDAHLITLLNPRATASETYRALRTSVQFSRPDALVETILVTSPNPGEGKSVTSANLAVVMAQSGRRVLLVDADLRRPTVHKKFGLPREPGLVQRLFGDEALTLESFQQVADDLYVLPAGSLAPNPSELLGSRRMRDFMRELQSLFDVVILDAPPVLAATDAVILSTQADATLVVVRSGSTRDYELESASDALEGVGAKVIGTVLNGFHVSKAYGYKYKYAYRYSQDYAYGYDATSD